eukprot:GGOE01000630.1.p1 GENE.GGOE01000630.1~~GGOE01000630.1.p1  ORF type:complete len:766 (-),score=229.22 GGOE01000630.1:549-2846(-)
MGGMVGILQHTVWCSEINAGPKNMGIHTRCLAFWDRNQLDFSHVRKKIDTQKVSIFFRFSLHLSLSSLPPRRPMLFQPISPHNHPLWHLDRFLDEKTEQQYCERAIPWGLAALRLQCLVAVLLNIYNIVVYSNLVEWWAPLIALLASVAIILASRFSVGVQQNSFALHSVFACFLVGVQCYIGWKQATEWSATDLNRFVIVRSQLSGSYLTPLEELSDNAVDNWGYIAFVDILISCWNQWVTLSLAGMNRWGFGALAVILAALLSTAYTSFGMETGSQLAILFTSVMFSFFSFCIGIAVDRARRLSFLSEKQLTQELQASQMADSVLNHSLKNTLADVAGNVEMFLAGALPTRVLEECIVTLRRGVRSCKERQGYLKLVAGQYEPVLNAINLQDFGRQLLAGRNATGRFLDCTIYADEMLLTLIFDNALSNAAKHGHPSCPEVTFTVEEIPADACRDLAEGRRRFSFQVTNIANPNSAELTPQFVQQLFAGCTAPQQQRISIVVPALSDRIGLAHCSMAAKLGGISLSLFQEDDLVTFTGMLDAEVSAVHRTTLDAEAPPAAPSFPAGLQFVVLDDSLCAQRLLRFHIQQWCAPASVICLGASAADIPPFLSHALLADIVILDEHLDWEVDRHLGSDLVRQLRRLRYEGFICVRSADDSPADQAHFLRAGANCSVGKDLLGPVMVQRLQAEYSAFVRPPLVAVNPAEPNEPRPPTPSPLPRSGMSVADLCPLPISDPTMGSESCAGSDNSATALSALILDEALFR